MKNLFVFGFLLMATFVGAQSDSYKIFGKVIEASSSQSIDYATIVVNDKNSGKVISGTTTKEGGKFELVTKTPNVTIEVSFIGYTPVKIDDVVFKERIADLGIIKLGEDAHTFR